MPKEYQFLRAGDFLGMGAAQNIGKWMQLWRKK